MKEGEALSLCKFRWPYIFSFRTRSYPARTLDIPTQNNCATAKLYRTELSTQTHCNYVFMFGYAATIMHFGDNRPGKIENTPHQDPLHLQLGAHNTKRTKTTIPSSFFEASHHTTNQVGRDHTCRSAKPAPLEAG